MKRMKDVYGRDKIAARNMKAAHRTEFMTMLQALDLKNYDPSRLSGDVGVSGDDLARLYYMNGYTYKKGAQK